MFIGRTHELASLAKHFDAPKPALIIMYGRRRVGKSTLLVHALAKRPAVYFQATRLAESDNVALFKGEVARALPVDPEFAGLSRWDYVLEYLRRFARERAPGLTVVLDEFPYLCEANEALPSMLQRFWDETVREGIRFNLVLCGSRIAFMKATLAERNPLYGRQTAVYDIAPLHLRDAASFFPTWTAADIVRAYAVFGGTPYYLAQCDPDVPLAENIRALVLDDAAPLRDEPQYMLQAELQQVARYASILQAIASGATKRAEIANRVLPGEGVETIGPYLNKLIALRLIRQEAAFGDGVSTRSRNLRFFLADPFLAFYHRFVLPNLSMLERTGSRDIYRHAIAPVLDEYVSGPFEEMCREYIRWHARDTLGAIAHRVGRIWFQDGDIDVVARLLNNSLAVGECKWSRKHVGLNMLEQLKENVIFAMDGPPPKRTYFLLFSRSGFSPQLRTLAASDDAIRLLGPEQMVGRE